MRNWFSQHGLIILVLVLGLMGSLILVWWRLGFTLEFFQPKAAPSCTSDAECSPYTCSNKGLCNQCGSDSDCAGKSHSCQGSEWFCVSEGLGFNHCVEDTSTCTPTTTTTTGGGGGGGGGTTLSDKAVFSLRNVNFTQGACSNASSFGGGDAHATVRTTDSGAVRTHIVFNVFHSDTAGCSATNQQPSAGGTRTGTCDFGAPHQSGDCTLSYAVGTHNCGRVQFDAAFSDGASGVFLGQVIDYGVDCGVAVTTQPPTTTAPPATHLACQSNACVSVSGAGTNECATDADCALPQLVCAPASQNVQAGQGANFTATGGTGTYAWSAPSGTPATGSGSTFSATYQNTGTYAVTVTSGAATAQCGVTLTEESQPPVCAPASQTVAAGQTATVTATGGSGTYEWTAPSGNPSSGSGSSFAVSYDGPGTYQVNMRDSVTQESAACQVSVPATPTPTPTPTATPAGPAIRLEKLVRNVTQNGVEADTVSANPQDTVEFVIRVSSVGTSNVIAARVRDTLPAGLAYMNGTTTLNNGTSLPDGIVSGGVGIGDLSPGQTDIVRFRARVSEEGFFESGTTVLQDTAFATSSNTPQVSDVAFVTVTRTPENPALALRKLGRNISRNETGERSRVLASPNETVEFTIRVQNISSVQAVNVNVQDVVPQGIAYQSGTATLNGQPTADSLATTGVNIGTLSPGVEAVVRFLGRVAPANQFPEGPTTLINVARTWALNIPVIQAQLPVIITNQPVSIPPVNTGPGETTVLALIISAIVTLMYIGYTSTDAFRRREALGLTRKPGGDFK